MTLLGVDTGGTFTDFVLWRDGRLHIHKVLSTPEAPERAILQGIAELGLGSASLRVIHGSTVATNAVLERKGVRTVFVTNRGFADLLSIGRQNRRALYELQPPTEPPPVPAELCLETGGRLAADGTTLEPLTEADLAEFRAALERLAPAAVAISLLYAYDDDRAERRLAECVPEGVFVSRSSEVLPEIREYERGMATWLNAWVGPLVQGYLERLGSSLDGDGNSSRVAVMQSSGETMAAAQAGRQAVRMLLSGPAAGLVAARFVAAAAGRERLLSFDMGGTSTDVALLDGAPRLTNQGRIGPYPVAVPMVEMHTIGAGGGSIAWLDTGGMLQVGPESAGADPGPACYGRGGKRPTVTDANLLLGHLPPQVRLGGDLPLDREAALGAVSNLAAALREEPLTLARGIVRVANEHMARALRTISVQRGIDPRGFTLVSFGGAGGLHVCALAEALELREALVPAHSGVLSALGMLVARPGRRLSRNCLGLLGEQTESRLEAGFAELFDQGRAALIGEGVAAADCQARPSVDLRYVGQSYTLNLPWRGLETTERDFHEHHDARYGHRMDLPVELVNLRQAVTGPVPEVELADPAPETPCDCEPLARVPVVGLPQPVPVYGRERLPAGLALIGPAILTESVATTWLEPGWRARVDTLGNLVLNRI
jgi:N-methylhydantoinase A